MALLSQQQRFLILRSEKWAQLAWVNPGGTANMRCVTVREDFSVYLIIILSPEVPYCEDCLIKKRSAATATDMRRIRDANVRVTGTGPITGEHYLRLQQKLQLELGDWQALMGVTVREHYLFANDPAAPISDPGLCLHIRLLDEYPDLITPAPNVIDLMQSVKQLKRDFPKTALPMSLSAQLVALMLGRNARTATIWNQGITKPPRKISSLIKHLQDLIDSHQAPDRALQRYCELIDSEARARGITNIFTARNWSAQDDDNDDDDDDND